MKKIFCVLILTFLIFSQNGIASSTFQSMKDDVSRGGWTVIWSESYGFGDAATLAACSYFGCAQSYLGYKLDNLKDKMGKQVIEQALRNKGKVIFGPGKLKMQAGTAYWSTYYKVWNPLKKRNEKVTTDRYVRLYVKYKRVTNSSNSTLFSWSYAGKLPGKHCVSLYEASKGNDGSTHTWGDNYLCTSKNYGIRFSMAGRIDGMRCTQLHEGASPHTWGDNFLCVPSSSNLNLSWSPAGPISGKKCTKINEPADPHTWNDNYLCY